MSTVKAESTISLASVKTVKEAADYVQMLADEARKNASGALNALSTVQDVIGVLNWASTNAVYQATLDRDPEPGKTYWIRSGTSPDYEYTPVPYTNVVVYRETTDTSVQQGTVYYELDQETGEYSEVTPAGTENPSEEGWYEFNLDTYFEILNSKETMAEYISSHLALVDDGLLVFADDESGQLLLSDAGVSVLDKDGIPIAIYGEDAVIGNKEGFHIIIDETEIGFYQGENNKVAYMNGDELYVKKRLSFGHFRFDERENGHFTLKLVD